MLAIFLGTFSCAYFGLFLGYLTVELYKRRIFSAFTLGDKAFLKIYDCTYFSDKVDGNCIVKAIQIGNTEYYKVTRISHIWGKNAFLAADNVPEIVKKSELIFLNDALNKNDKNDKNEAPDAN